MNRDQSTERLSSWASTASPIERAPLRAAQAEMQLCAFDLLTLDGDDLRDVPLSMRKANLTGLLGPMDREEMQKVRRLVEIIDACGASGTEPEAVFAWIEEDLRARLATTVGAGEL